jgi:integrase
MSPHPEREELRKLLDSYIAGKISREEFFLFAKDFALDEEKLKSLVKGFDEGRISKEEFIMWGTPPVPVAPAFPLEPEVDFLDAYGVFIGTKLYEDYSLSYKRGFKYFIKPFLEYLLEEGIHKVSEITELDFDRFLHIREGEWMKHLEEIGKKVEPYSKASVGNYCRHTKAFFSWMRKHYLRDLYRRLGLLGKIVPVHPFEFMDCPTSQGIPDIFGINVVKGVLVESEVNLIWETLFSRPESIEDWRRIVIELRILRETGLRPVHALRLEWGDIDTKRRIIWYDRIRRFVKRKKGLPFIPEIETPISSLLAKEVKSFIEERDVSLGSKIYTEYDTAGLGRKIRDWRTRVGLKPFAFSGVLFHAYMFRDSYATFVCNILPHPDDWKRWCGDDPETLRLHYVVPRMAHVYRDMGLEKFPDDVMKMVFEQEGVLEAERPRRVGRPRKKQAFILPEY